MALQTVINTKPDTPYHRLPVIHVCVVASREDRKVLHWDFTNGKATPGPVKTDKVAIISDGQSLASIRLFEEFAGRITDGVSYIFKGYSLRGARPPYTITVASGTRIFRSSDIQISEELRRGAQDMLCPPSVAVDLSSWRDSNGLITVMGNIIELSATRPVRGGNGGVPIRTATLQQDKTEAKLVLWREATVPNLTVGSHVEITHLLKKESKYGVQLHSTNYTTIKELKQVNKSNTTLDVNPNE